jgi:imidazole glycerol phosphate synthase glutamine amidotransferase subunit
MITIIDYGAGNLCSVRNALAEVNVEHEVVNSPAALRKATNIVLPGVGHFGQMMHALDTLQLREPLLDAIREHVPFFGICLGMQALLEGSEEAPGVAGLGLLPGIVRRFPADARVPHMGWNQLEDRTGCRPGSADYVYFAHSYYVPFDEHVACETCTYAGVRFTASLQNGNTQGVQYHPEKSGAFGLDIFRGVDAC